MYSAPPSEHGTRRPANADAESADVNASADADASADASADAAAPADD